MAFIIDQPSFCTTNTYSERENLNEHQIYAEIDSTTNTKQAKTTETPTTCIKMNIMTTTTTTMPFAPAVYQSSATLLHSLFYPPYEFIHSNDDSESSMENDENIEDSS